MKKIHNILNVVFLFYPIVIWACYRYEQKSLLYITGIIALVFFLFKKLKSFKTLLTLLVPVFLIAILFALTNVHWERLYPVLMAGWMLVLIIENKKHSEGFIYQYAKKIRIFTPTEQIRLKKTDYFWVAIFSVNFAILSVFLFIGGTDYWMLYAGIYSYIMIGISILGCVLYVNGLTKIKAHLLAIMSMFCHIVGFGVFGFLCLLFIPLILVLKIFFLFKAPNIFIKTIRTISFFSFRLVKWYSKKLGIIDWSFQYHVPKKNISPLLVSNHICLFDIVSIFSEFKLVNTFVNSKFVANPLLNTIIKASGYIPVQGSSQETNKMNAFQQASAAFNRGESMAIFPEGTRSKTGTLGPLQNGAFRLALEHRVDITPIIFTIDYPFLNKTHIFSRKFGGVRLVGHVLAPISIKGVENNRRGIILLKEEFQKIYNQFITTQPVILYPNFYKEYTIV